MKIWNKIKDPAILTLIALVLAFLRYVSYACPVWCPYIFWAPGLYLQIFSEEIFSVKFVLVEIVFWLIAVGALLLVPVGEQYGGSRRSLTCLLLVCLLIFGLSSFAIVANDGLENLYWDGKVNAYRREISDFLDEADEVVLHGHNSQHYSPYFTDERILCDCGAYHSVIMIDYDTMRIAFLRHDGISNFFIYELKPGALTEENTLEQLNALLPNSQTRLITYYPDTDSNHRTCAMELILADGTVYSTTDTPDGQWDNGYLEMGNVTQAYLFCVGQPHPQPDAEAE